MREETYEGRGGLKIFMRSWRPDGAPRAVVALCPLLGLLGTVTGMIDTFRVITLFGTSDPKLMSGGISEALVTTELGLAVAIPIMLCHTWLSRRSDHLIGDMEEKAVQLTNIIRKRKLAGQP